MFKNKKEDSKESKNNDIEIVIGDDSTLNISDVGDCMNDLRPKHEKKKTIVIPKTKKDKQKKQD